MQSFYNYFSSPRYIMKKPEPKMSKFYDVNEALEIGNSVKNEYIPYKNYQVKKIDTYTEEERKELMIMKYEFLLLDLKLYLDTHPDCFEAKTLYEETKKGYCDFLEQNGEILDAKKPWPWEGWKR